MSILLLDTIDNPSALSDNYTGYPTIHTTIQSHRYKIVCQRVTRDMIDLVLMDNGTECGFRGWLRGYPIPRNVPAEFSDCIAECEHLIAPRWK